MILHTVNKETAFELCRDVIAAGDQLLLIEDGVYLALVQTMDCAALRSDVEARGLTARLPAHVRLVDYGDFVAMAAEAESICCWF